MLSLPKYGTINTIIMELNLKRALAFFDIETTGLNISTDRIVEMHILKIHPNGEQENRTFLINPEMPIPPKVTEIHSISDDDVKDKPTFAQLAKIIAHFLEGCDFAGFNSNKFDIPILAEEFLRTGIDFDVSKHRFIDAQVIFYKMEQRTLSAAYKFYCGKELEDAHTAKADTLATYEVLKAQLDRYPNLVNDVEELSKFSSHNKNVDFAGRIIYDENEEEIFNFGKHKGQKVKDVFLKDPHFYKWMMDGEFPLNTKQILTKLKLKYFSN